MIILYALLGAIAANESKTTRTPDARAVVVIVQGSEISPRTWKPATRPSQREITIKEKDGRRVLVRLSEFE